MREQRPGRATLGDIFTSQISASSRNKRIQAGSSRVNAQHVHTGLTRYIFIHSARWPRRESMEQKKRVHPRPLLYAWYRVGNILTGPVIIDTIHSRAANNRDEQKNAGKGRERHSLNGPYGFCGSATRVATFFLTARNSTRHVTLPFLYRGTCFEGQLRGMVGRFIQGFICHVKSGSFEESFLCGAIMIDLCVNVIITQATGGCNISGGSCGCFKGIKSRNL